jgi:hypothetical protein
MKIWTDGEHFVIEQTAEAAFKVMLKFFGLSEDADDEVLRDNGVEPLIEWHDLDDHTEFRLFDEETNSTKIQTCAEWCATEKPGYLGSHNH